MEIQIELILFTTFLAWSAGILITQSVLVLQNQGKGVQLPCLITALAVLAVGGIAVMFHLAQPFHIFNGFGNPTSGITQELIAVVVLVIVMLVFFIMLRRSDDGMSAPKWIAIVLIVVAVLLDVVMSHSYMMAARPVWNSFVQILSILGGSCIMGPATVAVIAALRGDDSAKGLPKLVVAGAVANAVITLAYLINMSVVGNAFMNIPFYFDSAHPLKEMTTAAQVSPLSSECIGATAVVLVGMIVSVVAAFMGKLKGNWMIWGAAALVGGLLCVIALRVAFYILGFDIFMLF